MKVVVFGASGMVGGGVLRECLRARDVEAIASVGRALLPGHLAHAKLKEIQHADFLDFHSLEQALTGYDACFWCLGIPAPSGQESSKHSSAKAEEFRHFV